MEKILLEDALKFFKLTERLDEKAARQIAENNKPAAFGLVDKMKLWNRPTTESVTIIDCVRRYEPFWYLSAIRCIKYKSISSYSIDVANKDSRAVEINGVIHEVKEDGKIHIPGTEHCTSSLEHVEHLYGVERDVSKKEIMDYLKKHSSEQSELSEEEVLQDNLLIQPEKKMAAVLHRVEKELAHAVNASEILEDKLTFQKVFYITIRYMLLSVFGLKVLFWKWTDCMENRSAAESLKRRWFLWLKIQIFLWMLLAMRLI